jgi:hypothetical protein
MTRMLMSDDSRYSKSLPNNTFTRRFWNVLVQSLICFILMFQAIAPAVESQLLVSPSNLRIDGGLPVQSGTVLHVAKHGKDTYTCSQATNPDTPKLTIRAALACIGTAKGAGATHAVEVAAGTYPELIRDTDMPTGTSWNSPFVLRTKKGDLVTIKAPADHNIRLSPTSVTDYYVAVDGFVFDGTNGTNTQIVLNSSRFVIFRNNKVVNTARENAIYVGTKSRDIRILNNTIHAGAFITQSNSQGVNHGIYFSGDNSLIADNQIYDVAGWAIHIYSGHIDKPDNNLVRGNLVYGFGKSAPASGILAGSGTSNEVYDNTVHSSSPNFCSSGISVGYGGTNSKVYRNIVYGHCKGIVTLASSINPVITDNRVYYNTTNLDLKGTGVLSSANITTPE